MKQVLLIVLLSLGITPVAGAQSATVPPAPTDAGQELLLPVPACKACAHADASKRQTTALGRFLHVVTAPLRWACGGHSETASAEEFASLSPSSVSLAEAAASKIKADEAGAKSRRAAVHYLGTVDCHYYPEAEAALVAAVRADRNEGVRLEAVMALGNGCCRTKRTMDALNLVVSGSEQDGNPAETSGAFAIAAAKALQQYMTHGTESIARNAPETLPPLIRSQIEPSHLQLAGYVADMETHKRDACAT